jgi:hypothetical protein
LENRMSVLGTYCEDEGRYWSQLLVVDEGHDVRQVTIASSRIQHSIRKKKVK